jgi:WD40-like Beta Propeller Repeat
LSLYRLDSGDEVHYGIPIMMNRILVSAVIATAVATLAIAGCGGSTNGNNGGNTGGDSGVGTTGGDSGGGGGGDGAVTPGTDGGAMSSDAATGANPPLPDGSILPHGNQLADGGALALNGVTSDDYVIYTDTSSSTAYAISLAPGSTAISLGTVDQYDDVIVLGKVVILGTSLAAGGGNNGPAAGAASIWTSAASAPASLGSAVAIYSQYANEIAASSDGTHVVFVDDVNAAGTEGDIYMAAADGSGKTLLVGSVDVAYDECTAALAFAGTHAVGAYCVVPDGGAVDAGLADGGTNFNVATVSSFTEANGTPAPIATNVQAVFSVDPGGTTVVVNGASGTVAYPIAGGTAVAIDATGTLGAVSYSPGLLTSDGSHLLYTTTAQALERAATTAPPSPTQLAGSGTFSDVFVLSPDGNWVTGTLNQGNGGTDLYLASAATAGTPTALDSTTDSSPLFGDFFTADSSHVVYASGLGQNGGTLNARALTSGATATVLATNAASDYATTAAKIVFNANVTNTGNGEYADLSGVDTSQTAPPALLVSQADPTFFLNSEKTTIVYTWSYQAGASTGLWTLPAP